LGWDLHRVHLLHRRQTVLLGRAILRRHRRVRLMLTRVGILRLHLGLRMKGMAALRLHGRETWPLHAPRALGWRKALCAALAIVRCVSRACRTLLHLTLLKMGRRSLALLLRLRVDLCLVGLSLLSVHLAILLVLHVLCILSVLSRCQVRWHRDALHLLRLLAGHPLLHLVHVLGLLR
jgi:hypothetical protein